MNRIILAMIMVLSLIGILVSFYISYSRVRKKPLVCHANENCNEVVESKWSNIFYIKNDILGLVYYLLVLFEASYILAYSKDILFFMELTTSLAALFSIALLFIQFKILKKYCFYCVVSAVVNLYIYIGVLALSA